MIKDPTGSASSALMDRFLARHTSDNPLVVAHSIHSGGFFGAEKVLSELALAQSKHANLRIKLLTFLDRIQPENELLRRMEQAGIEVIHFNTGRGITPVSLMRYARIMNSAGISLVHSHGYKPTLFHVLGRMLGFYSIPILVTAHGYNRGAANWKAKLYTKLDLLAFSKVDQVVTVSKETASFVKDRNAKAKVKTISNGIDLGVSLKGTHPLRAALSSRPKVRKIIGSVGRLLPVKNHCLLIDAVAALGPREDFSLAIIGDGRMRNEICQHWKRKLPWSEPAVFPFQNDILEWMNDMDVFVLPSLTEGLPMVVLEAGLLEKPVIASEVGGVPEVIRHRQNGLLFKSGDEAALTRYLKEILDGDGGRSLGLRLKQDVYDRFSLESTSQSYIEAYANIL